MTEHVQFQGRTVDGRTFAKLAASVRLLLDAQPWREGDTVDPLVVDVRAKGWRSILVGAKRAMDDGALPGIAIAIVAGAAREAGVAQ